VSLMTVLPALSKEDCNEIVFAVSTFGPSSYRSVPRYNDPSSLMLLNREAVISALQEVYTVYGTARVLVIIRMLECER
jgi:hypothetical protein